MKKNIIVLLLLGSFFSSKAQLTLEHDYGNGSNEDYSVGNNPLNYPLEIVNLSTSGMKYALQDMANGQVRLYNLDHSLWKTINLPSIPSYLPITAYYISENLFKIDNKVDLAIMYLDTSSNYASEKQVISDETGSIINTIDSSFNLQVFNTAPGTFVAVSNYHGAADFVGMGNLLYGHCRVYSLPGTIPCSNCGNGMGLGKVGPKQNVISDPIPNPSSNQVKLTFSLPIGIKTGEIEIFNMNGQKLKAYQVDNTFSFINIDNSDLPTGIYYYNLVCKGTIADTKKMLVTK